MDAPTVKLPRVQAYRRLAIGISITSGIAIGLGLAGLAVLGSGPWPILILVIPLGIRAVGSASGRLTFRDRTVGWMWPIVALVVAVPLTVLLPVGLAPVTLGVAVALWFTILVVGGVSTWPWIPRAGWESKTRDAADVPLAVDRLVTFPHAGRPRVTSSDVAPLLSPESKSRDR
jgi:hypothetical protein